MFRIFGLLCIMSMGEVDCTTHYRTDLQIYNTREQCEKAMPPIMEETLGAFKTLGMTYQSFQMGCEEITDEQYKQWQLDKMNSTDDEV